MNNKKKKIKRVIFAYYLTIERWKIKWSRNSLSKKKKKKNSFIFILISQDKKILYFPYQNKTKPNSCKLLQETVKHTNRSLWIYSNNYRAIYYRRANY